MPSVTLLEYEKRRLPEPPGAWEMLRRLDEQWAGERGETVLEWGHRHYVRARNYVGVMQAGELQVEILPKIDFEAEPGRGGEAVDRARGNLLYMLSLTGDLPFEERHLAELKHKRMPLLDAFIVLFARSLLAEVRRGLHRGYQPMEDELSTVKGRLLLPQQLRRNLLRPDRLWVDFDEFTEDTPINQRLKAACTVLSRVARAVPAIQLLQECRALFAEVSDVSPASLLARPVHFSRQSERFRFLTRFAENVLRGWSPDLAGGGARAFSLCVPMEQVYEQFIAALLQRNAGALGLQGYRICIQAQGASRWLLRRGDGLGVFQLRPDVVIDKAGETHLVLDTKWKRLSTDVEDRRNGVSQADLYQLTAYAVRYRCPDCVLLYPQVPGATRKTYYLDLGPRSPKLRIEFVNLNRNLQAERRQLLSELAEIMRPGGALPPPGIDSRHPAAAHFAPA